MYNTIKSILSRAIDYLRQRQSMKFSKFLFSIQIVRLEKKSDVQIVTDNYCVWCIKEEKKKKTSSAIKL
jgi:hypothetical protein